MQVKAFTIEHLELKDGENEQGLFSGFAAVYGNVDRTGDVVLPGAFKQSLADNGSRVKLLYQHRQDMPIGLGTLTDTEVGLQITGQLAMRVSEAQKAWELLKAGVIDSMSIGYDTVKATFKDGVRRLQELKLWEVSLVTIPANPLATVLGMKANCVLGAIDGVKAAEDGAVDALFDAVAEMGASLVEEQKAGRVLSARNRALVKAAFEALQALIDAAEKQPADEGEGDGEGSKAHAQVSEADATELLSLFSTNTAALAASLKRE